MPDPPDPVLAPGTMVGAYRVDDPLGSGGMGTVYAAEEPTIGKRAAIKVLRRALADEPSVAARFEREARAVNEIGHPGIVDVFAFGKLADGRPYLVMSLLKGRSLRDELARRPQLAPREAWRIARAIGEALAAAHKSGIVHRDLKPDNVFLEQHETEPSRPRVLDFGLAKVDESLEGADLAKLTQSGTPLGTPVYMAPEQWWCKAVDGRTDQYALAIVLFEMLAGRPPFASTQYVELLQQHLHETPPSLTDLGVNTTEEVVRFLVRSLAKEPDQRFPSMGAWIDAGDVAFASEADDAPSTVGNVATSATEIALPHASEARPPTPQRAPSAVHSPIEKPPSLRRHAIAHFALLAVGLGVGGWMGYAGDARHDPARLVEIAGWGPYASAFWFLLAAAALPLIARRRAMTARTTTVGWWLAMIAMICGAFSSYTGWALVNEHARDLPLDERFVLWNLGLYEANAGRFVGLLFAIPILLSLAAMAGVTEAAALTRSRVAAVGARRGELWAGTALLGLAGVVSIALGAPSATYIAWVAALGVATGLMIPTLHPDTAARDELERTVASTLAVVAAVAVGFARIEAREATAWFEDVPRSVRVAEIAEATRERSTTTLIAVVAVGIVLALEIVRIRRLRAEGQALRPPRSAWIMMTLLTAVALGDLALHRDFFQARNAMRAQIEAQFALFARLEPPIRADLPAPPFAPHPVPNLQVAPNLVALGGKGLAPLAALDSSDGAMNIGRDLMHELGESSRLKAEASLGPSPDLALTIDGTVRYADVQRVLVVARRSGVRTAELRLAREETPLLGGDAPPEARFVLPRDFVALPVTLGDRGFSADADATFASAIAAMNPSAGEALALAVPLQSP